MIAGAFSFNVIELIFGLLQRHDHNPALRRISKLPQTLSDQLVTIGAAVETTKPSEPPV